MPEQAPGDYDTYWWNGDTYMKWDLETGATSQVHGSDWKQNGKYFHHGTETNKVEEVPVKQYYANTGQEGYWKDNGKVYHYDPGEKKVQEVSSTGYWKDESGAVYTYDESTEQPRRISSDGYWAEGGKYYRLGAGGEKIKISAVDFVLKGAKVTQGIRKTIKLELDQIESEKRGENVYHITGYSEDIECMAQVCYYYEADGKQKVFADYGPFVGTSIGNLVGGLTKLHIKDGMPIKDLLGDSVTENIAQDAIDETARKEAGSADKLSNVGNVAGDHIENLGDNKKDNKGNTDKGGSQDSENSNKISSVPKSETENDSTLEKNHKHLSSQAGWHCEGKLAVKTDSAGNEVERKKCDYKCLNGECIEKPCTPLSCSYYYARKQCGLGLDNGCNGVLNCDSCPAGLQCVKGFCRCVPKTKCSEKSECGFENDGCGGRVSCGKCHQGFQCNEYWHECVPEQEKQKLEIQNINAFVYSNHAIISWTTSRRADSMLEAGTTPQLGFFKKVSNSAINHSVLLDGLKTGQTYYYKVRARVEGQAVESKVLSFTTKLAGETGLKVLFVSVDPPGRVQYEGYSFGFTAVTNASDQSKLEFNWDFGDETRAENAGYIFFHAYYGLLTKEKDFNVRVSVKDDKGQTASATVTVTVLKAVFKPMLLKPKPFETVSKKGDLNVVIGFVDENNAVIPCSDVNLRVLLENNPIKMKCLLGNSFSGSIHPGPGVNEMQLLRIAAEYKKNGKQYLTRTRAPVYFAPLKVKATSAFGDKPYHLNDTIKNARVRFLIENMFIATPEKIEASLVSTKQEKKVEVEKSGYDYVLHLDHRVNEADLENGLALRLAGRDSRGNIIAEFQGVPLEGNSPELTINVLEPTKGKTYTLGARVVVKAKLFSNNSLLRDKRLYLKCKDLGIEREMEYDAFKKEYSAYIDLPGVSSSKSELTLKLYASAVVGKKPVESVRFVHLNLSTNLKPVFVFPRESTSILRDNVPEVYVKLLQPNGKIFNAQSLEALLLVDGNSENVVLNFDAGRGLYHAFLPKPISLGVHSLKLTLGGGYNGSTSVLTTIKKENLLWEILLLGALVLAFLLLALFTLRLVKSLALERKLLLNQKKRLLGLKKKYKYEYYKRHIDETEFRKSTKKINKAITLVNSLLKKKYWFYVGFFKAFFKENIKKYPEFLQVASLVIRLAGRRGEFSRPEIARAMAEEKHSQHVIEKVLEKLYK